MVSKKRHTKRLSPLPLLLACILLLASSLVQAEEPVVVAKRENNHADASPATTTSPSDDGENKVNEDASSITTVHKVSHPQGPAPVHSPISANNGAEKESSNVGGSDIKDPPPKGYNDDDITYTDPLADAIKRANKLGKYKYDPSSNNDDDAKYYEQSLNTHLRRRFREILAKHPANIAPQDIEEMRIEVDNLALIGIPPREVNDALNEEVAKLKQERIQNTPGTPENFYTEEMTREIQALLKSGVEDPHEFIERKKKKAIAAAAAAAVDADAEVRNMEEGERVYWEGGSVVLDTKGNVLSDDSQGEKKQSSSSSTQPSSQPTTNSPTNNRKVYEHVYSQIFNPNMEEYDMLKFDPYSFSGAPLGGWGRATRSRLATLPIRLVSDFDGGVDLLYGTGSAGGASDELVGEEKDDNADESSLDKGNHVNEEHGDSTVSSQENTNESTETKSKDVAASKNKYSVKPSTGPHFAVHDATGQKYICRVYAEEELVVLSRLDSVFHPAVTIWDESLIDGIDASHIAGAADDEADQDDVDNNDSHTKKKFQFSINSANTENDESLPEGVRSSVAKMLRKMGMNDAAEALNGEQRLNDIANNPEAYGFTNGNVGVEVDVEMDVQVVVADADGNLMDGGELDGMDLEDITNGAVNGADPNMANLANIIKAAAVGAGMKPGAQDENGNPESGSDNNNSIDKKSLAPSTPQQLTSTQIFFLLHQLNRVCSQLHLGWWSYEWCHQEQVRQFHVAVSNNPAIPKYDIQDVTLVGKYNREEEILVHYPGGVNNGEQIKGKTTSVKFDKRGREVSTTTREHTPEEDAHYVRSQQFSLDNDTSDKKKKANDKQQDQKKKVAQYRGPIIEQIFDSGGFCEEAGHNRLMHVELRCCTEEEIDYWSESRSPSNKKKDSNNKKEKKPKAVLVSVREEETCRYRSRVCTPLLCPNQPAVAREKKKTIDSSASSNKTRKDQKEDPIGALLHAIFGDDIAEMGQVQVYFPDDITGHEFDELIRQAEDGMDFTNNALFQRVKKALRKAKGSGSNPLKKSQTFNVKDLIMGGDNEVGIGNTGGAGSVMEVRNGESIREILDKTLGKRPCLKKNLGWWTYEFCHTKQIKQYHANNFIDATTGFTKQKIETQHILGVYKNSGNDMSDYPNADEYLHIVNATGSSADFVAGQRKGTNSHTQAQNTGSKKAGGNGAVYEQEYKHGDVCDHEDVAESVIKGGNVVQGSVERATTVRFSCGKRWELIDANEDSTCHYVLDVTVPELCQHMLFKAAVTKTQVVKCLPV
eukprot:CAMPEP_0172327932 /NCGR_PEP_ID=MMETSP1058-20130122/60086_1 /TAXON_ID=83371 /ORGANISM="Detonula confervacea, Strain CCMP 353" /LENGTH=1275 /DNA_ID=CAMNT_0013045021 /DNA_START=549 /DNA_END=4376 /DNA_ORIENTATION=-